LPTFKGREGKDRGVGGREGKGERGKEGKGEGEGRGKVASWLLGGWTPLIKTSEDPVCRSLGKQQEDED